MMHLKYPRKAGFIYWDELGCLARALGFHEKIFLNNLPDEYSAGQLGMTIKTLHEIFDLHKYMNTALDRSCNIHTDEWNIHCIKRAVRLIDKHVFTYEEIARIRVAFQIYESGDTRGMHMSEKILQRAIKMCDRMISPQKMMQRVKHMSQRFEESDRIQLHEFFDLLLWCELYKEIVVKVEDLNVRKDERGLYELEDFEEMLSYYDERLALDLDSCYRKEELKYAKEKHGSKRMPKDVPPVDEQIRKKQVEYHRQRYKVLHRELGESSQRVTKSQAGLVRGRPVSAPDLTMYQHLDPSMAVSALDYRQWSVKDMFGHLFRPTTAPPVLEFAAERPDLTEYCRPEPTVAVTGQEVEATNNQVDTLKFQMETIEMKYKQMLNDDLDYLVPGYKEKMGNGPKTAPAPPPPRPKRDPRPSPGVMERLASPHKHGQPLPSHAKACDARFRGWHKVKSRRGPHFVLASRTFDASPTGAMLTKMQKSADDEISRPPAIYRFTHPHQVVHELQRPHTSPAILVDKTSECSRQNDFSFKSDSGSFYKEDYLQVEPVSAGIPVSSDVGTSLQKDEENEHTGDNSARSNESSDISWTDLAIYNNSDEAEKSDSQSRGSSKYTTKDCSTELNSFNQSSRLLAKDQRGLKGRVVERPTRLTQIPEKDEVPDSVTPVSDGQKNRADSDSMASGDSVQQIISKSTTKATLKPSDVMLEVSQKHQNMTNSLNQENKPVKYTQISSDIEPQNNKNPGKTSIDVETSNEYIDPWFNKTTKLRSYTFVKEIMNTDYSYRHGKSIKGYNFYRLYRRGKKEISDQFRQKLSRGLSA